MDAAFENTSQILAIDKTTTVCYVIESVALISRLAGIDSQTGFHYHVTKPASIFFSVFKLMFNMNASRPLLFILFDYLNGFGLDETVEFRLKRSESCWLASNLWNCQSKTEFEELIFDRTLTSSISRATMWSTFCVNCEEYTSKLCRSLLMGKTRMIIQAKARCSGRRGSLSLLP